MADSIYNVEDKTARLALIYGKHNLHSGNGKLIRHKVEPSGSDSIITVQLALGIAPLHNIIKATYDDYDIPSQNWLFHKGAGEDHQDAYFPQDVPHPGASWVNFRLPTGFSADNQPDKAVFQIEGREMADYNSAGVQTDFGYSVNPGRIAADGTKLLTGSTSLIEMGSLDEFKAWCAETISITKDGNTVQIPRFELQIFLIPPFILKQFLDKVTQLTCSDWQWRNGKIRFIPAINRNSEFTFDLSRVALDFNFQTINKSERPNGVIVSYRDIDDSRLREAEPVIVKRQALIDADDGIENFLPINAGVCNQSQAERVANYWAKLRCDLTDIGNIVGSWKSYHILPGDITTLTHTTPNWVNKRCKVIRKTENEDTGIGYPFALQLEPNNPYSDTDHTPLVTRTPVTGANPYSAPPTPNLSLTEESTTLNDGTVEKSVKGTVTFGSFGFRQFAKIYCTRPGKSAELFTEITPDGNNQATFRARNLPVGMNYFKAVAVSDLGVVNSTVGGEQSSNVAAFDFQASGRINGLDPFGSYRGRDVTLVTQSAITAKIDSVSIVNNDVDVLLGITINNLGVDGNGDPILNNSDSVNAIQVDVYNQFGELVKSFSPSAANPIGGQYICKFSRKYADPESGQAYFKITIRNYFGYSIPVYLQGNTVTTTPPTAKVRANCPLESSAVPFSSSAIRCFYTFSGNVNLLRRRPGETDWITHATAITASPYLASELSEYLEYEFQFESAANQANKSNIFREFTKQQGEVAPSRPTPTSIAGGVNSSNPQTQLDFSCISAANVETEVWVNGSLATTLSAVTIGGAINHSITGLSANTTRAVKFRHKWGTGDFSEFTEEISRTTSNPPPSEQTPIIDYGFYNETEQLVDCSFTPRQGTGNFVVERNTGVSWAVILPNLDSAETNFLNAIIQTRYGKYVYFRIKRANSALSEPYSNEFEIWIPPVDDGSQF